MKTDDIIVKKSNINGFGVFAGRDFKVGVIVLRWDISNVLSDDEVAKLSVEEKKYISYVNGKYIVMQDTERYVNHSCDANTKAEKFCDIAARDIKMGEEITSNYEKTSPANARMKCDCGSKNCQGVFTS